jgi:hypothetical protein
LACCFPLCPHAAACPIPPPRPTQIKCVVGGVANAALAVASVVARGFKACGCVKKSK